MDAENKLKSHGLRVTAVRLLVLRTVQQMHRAFSLSDVLAELPHMDESSIFRTLRRFVEARLLHEVNDGTDSCKYCVCRDEHHDHASLVHHFHFHCTDCGQTFCLEQLPPPAVPQLEGYVVTDAEFVLKGLCPKCSRRNL